MDDKVKQYIIINSIRKTFLASDGLFQFLELYKPKLLAQCQVKELKSVEHIKLIRV